MAVSDHNYDCGGLLIGADGAWRVIGPTDPGPQPHGTGGEMVLWQSDDQGARWRKVRALTAGSQRNHTYFRRAIPAHPDFAGFWADGDPLRSSPSDLYFCGEEGTAFRMPRQFSGVDVEPEPLRKR